MYELEFGDIPYVILLLSVFFVVYGSVLKYFQGSPVGIRLNFTSNVFSPIDKLLSTTLFWIWILIFISWLLGVLIGLINGVDPKNVFRNFFGLVLYLIFPIMLIVSPSIKSLIIMIFLSGIIQMCYGFQRSYDLILNPALFYIEMSVSEMRSFYNPGFIVIFPLFVVGVAGQLLSKKYYSYNYGKLVSALSNSMIFSILTALALIVPAMSKGYILATILLLLMIVFISIRYSIGAYRIHKHIIALFFLFGILLYVLPSNFYDYMIYTYSSQEESNYIRSEQFGYIVSDLKIFGNGLGSSLGTGYERDPSGYGFELTYVNIVHKLGVLSIFLFSSYLITIFIAAIRILRKVYVFESIFVFGLMGYMIVGAGNPLLLSSSAVVLHCIAMYILVKPFYIPNNTCVSEV